ncbi:MAG: apolipoprotein N-acyltransferase [Planctomycetota bacterium]|nr:MAG: apolipoprotein N-acyltransferase [Planctomycetota bacterium]
MLPIPSHSIRVDSTTGGSADTSSGAENDRPVPCREFGVSGRRVAGMADAAAVRALIREARRKRGGVRGAMVCVAIGAACLWAAFYPLAWAPLAWVALVPLVLLVRIPASTRRMYAVLYAGGLAFWLAALQWMRLGDVRMYPAWVLLAAYLAVYFPLFVLAARGLHHVVRLPVVLAVPLSWVGWEFVRAHVLTGFAWYQLGHSQHSWTTLIQVSDLVGAYGVSFVVALLAAAAGQCVPASLLHRCGLLGERPKEPTVAGMPAAELYGLGAVRPAVGSAVFALAVLGAVCAYGVARRAGVVFQPGPRVALIQGNFRSSLKHDPEEWGRIYRTHEALTGLAVRYQPDLIVWPETMFRWPLRQVETGVNDTELLALGGPGVSDYREDWIRAWRDTTVPGTLAELSQKAGAELLIGIERHVAGGDRIRRYNSAVFVTPQGGIVGAYDKIHRVIFGEYVPLKDALPFLQALSPFPPDWGLEAGAAPKAFASKAEEARWIPIICFEDTVPHLVRRYLSDVAEVSGDRRCLVNLTNDGWFAGSSEQEQHLVTAAFRCVENRVPMIRAVNTGISAIIDGDGVVREPEVVLDGDAWMHGGRDDASIGLRDPRTGRWRKNANLVLVGSVPLDARSSPYQRWGDWFAEVCCFAAVCGVLCMLPPLERLLGRHACRVR